MTRPTAPAPTGLTAPRSAAQVTVVHAEACHFCIDARVALELLSDEFPLSVEFVAASEPWGAALLARHRAAMFPLVLLDGAFFSSGRLPRRKLRSILERRVAAATADSAATSPSPAVW